MARNLKISVDGDKAIDIRNKNNPELREWDRKDAQENCGFKNTQLLTEWRKGNTPQALQVLFNLYHFSELESWDEFMEQVVTIVEIEVLP